MPEPRSQPGIGGYGRAGAPPPGSPALERAAGRRASSAGVPLPGRPRPRARPRSLPKQSVGASRRRPHRPSRQLGETARDRPDIGALQHQTRHLVEDRDELAEQGILRRQRLAVCLQARQPEIRRSFDRLSTLVVHRSHRLPARRRRRVARIRCCPFVRARARWSAARFGTRRGDEPPLHFSRLHPSRGQPLEQLQHLDD